jgi:hypothetical protein
MATTTPNYGWPVPTSTDYVKDGATAIEALGDAIDATVFGLSGPTWTTYTPTLTSVGGTITSYTVNTARWAQSGKVFFIQFDVSITNNGTGGTGLNLTIPAGKTAKNINQVGSGRELSVSGSMLQIFLTTTSELRIYDYKNAYPAGTGARVCGFITYELA